MPRSSDQSRARAPQPPAERGGARIHERRIKNGLRVLIAERHLDPVVSVILYYKVGAVDEAESTAGVSHFLEHMMFKGTPRFGKGSIDTRTAALGGQNNAFTGYDHTGYWYEFSSDRWEAALELEADRMRHLLLEPSEFDSERKVVLEELAMGEDEPWRVLSRRVEARLFGRHPYGRPIIGFTDTLAALTPAAMRAHYERFYHPRNATLLICGDVVPAKAFKAVEEHFGALGLDSVLAPGKRTGAKAQTLGSKGGSSARTAKRAQLPAADALSPAPATRDDQRTHTRPPGEAPFGEQRLQMLWPDSAKRLCMAWRGAPAGSSADYALDLIVVLLTSGRNSRLQRRLVLDGALATSVSAYNDSRVEDGAFWIQAQCRDSIAPEALEAALDAELERLASEPASAAELDRARRMLKASEAHDAETTSDLAEELGGWAIDVDWTHALDGGRRHASVSAEDLRRTATELLRRNRRVVGWCLPSGESGGGEGTAATGDSAADSDDE
jgi:zinc protease